MPDWTPLVSDFAAVTGTPLLMILVGPRVNQNRTNVASAKLSFSYFRSLVLLIAFMCFLHRATELEIPNPIPFLRLVAQVAVAGTARKPCVTLFVSVYVPTIAPPGLIPKACVPIAAGKSMDVYPSAVFKKP